jgi:hypothetical protein
LNRRQAAGLVRPHLRRVHLAQMARPGPSIAVAVRAQYFFGFRILQSCQAGNLEYQYVAGVMGLLAMPIRPLLEGEWAVFGPEEIMGITAAFEDALKQLGLVDRKDPVVLLVARTTISSFGNGATFMASRTDHYRHLAQECYRIANTLPAGSSSRTSLLEMARVWERLAHEVAPTMQQQQQVQPERNDEE